MLSLDDQYIDSLMMGLNRSLDVQWFPNLLYRDIQVSSIVYTDEMIKELIIRFDRRGFTLTKIRPPKSGQTWIRVRKHV